MDWNSLLACASPAAVSLLLLPPMTMILQQLIPFGSTQCLVLELRSVQCVKCGEVQDYSQNKVV